MNNLPELKRIAPGHYIYTPGEIVAGILPEFDEGEICLVDVMEKEEYHEATVD